MAAELELRIHGPCNFAITGEIERGDFETLVASLDQLIIQNEMGWTDGTRVCLDSPGGSVYEGVRIARFFYEEGISTYVGEGAICHSICAVMFMMGTVRGDEIARHHRTLHVHGSLGFHRIYTTLEDARDYTSGDMNEMFDFGVEGVLELMSLANLRNPAGYGRMIHPDLFALMLDTPSWEMELVDTVEEVIGFDIMLDGVAPFAAPTRVHFNNACENALGARTLIPTLQYGWGPMSGAVFAFEPISAHALWLSTEAEVTSLEGEILYRVQSLRSGYYTSNCTVKLGQHVDSPRVLLCARDGRTQVSIGECDRTFTYWPQTVLFHPATSIELLNEPLIQDFDAARFSNCTLQGVVSDCIQLVTFHHSDGEARVEHLFLIPDQEPVRIAVEADYYRDEAPDFFLDGLPAERVFDVSIGRDCLVATSQNIEICTLDAL